MINIRTNRILISQSFNAKDLTYLLGLMYRCVSKLNYQEIVLDFSRCGAVRRGPMVAVCAQANRLRREEGIDFELILPVDRKTQRLFKNANWAHLIDPSNHEVSKFTGFQQVPTVQFMTTEGQTIAVNTILDKILGSLSGFTRTDLAAIEWSLNEITDNVLNHARSDLGGFVQLSTFTRTQSRIEFVVCDPGIGIPASLRENLLDIGGDTEALDFAIREGGTKDKALNQGNGLFGAFEICRVSQGYMYIYSGHAVLEHTERDGLHIRYEKIPFNGTLLISGIDYSDAGLLARALRFGGKQHFPTDFIETSFEDADGRKITFVVKNEATSFGSRKAAQPIRSKLQNLIDLCGNHKIFVDFQDIPVISSSFADEVFGKMFVDMGPLVFIQKFEFLNVNDTVKSLIDRAISLRTTQ